MVAWVVVQEDIEAHSQFGRLSLERILHSLGMDIRRSWSEDGRGLLEGEVISEGNENSFGYTHRSPFTGKICYGKRYVGSAREDGRMGRFIDRFLDQPLDENRKNRPRVAVKN